MLLDAEHKSQLTGPTLCWHTAGQMKLSMYLVENGLTGAQFGERVEASAEAVRLWVNGQRLPSRGSMNRIMEATGGAVQPNDFFEPSNGAPREAGQENAA